MKQVEIPQATHEFELMLHLRMRVFFLALVFREGAAFQSTARNSSCVSSSRYGLQDEEAANWPPLGNFNPECMEYGCWSPESEKWAKDITARMKAIHKNFQDDVLEQIEYWSKFDSNETLKREGYLQRAKKMDSDLLEMIQLASRAEGLASHTSHKVYDKNFDQFHYEALFKPKELAQNGLLTKLIEGANSLQNTNVMDTLITSNYETAKKKSTGKSWSFYSYCKNAWATFQASSSARKMADLVTSTIKWTMRKIYKLGPKLWYVRLFQIKRALEDDRALQNARQRPRQVVAFPDPHPLEYVLDRRFWNIKDWQGNPPDWMNRWEKGIDRLENGDLAAALVLNDQFFLELKQRYKDEDIGSDVVAHFKEGKVGLEVNDENGKIVKVEPGSKAQKKKVRVGMTIVQIDDTIGFDKELWEQKKKQEGGYWLTFRMVKDENKGEAEVEQDEKKTSKSKAVALGVG